MTTTPPCTCSPDSSGIQTQIENFYTTVTNNGEEAAGLSVGIINGVDSSGNPVITRCYSGYANVDTGQKIDEDTIFEIGSTTKTFTTAMLAEAVNKGKVSLDNTAQSYYDQFGISVTLPVYTDPNTGTKYPITMLDLADFTSGIPDKDPTNRTTGPNEYTDAMMYEYLEGLGSRFCQPGTQYLYVNTNFGIIAQLMMLLKKHHTYHDALKHFFKKADLRMHKTGVIKSNNPLIPHLAQGYSHTGEVVSDYALNTWPALQGAGAIHSGLDDMLEWLQFNMGLTNSPYNDLLPILQEARFSRGKGRSTGLGWFINPLTGTELTLINKNGGTSGFHSWIGFLPASNIGAILLCNSALAGKDSGGSSPVDALGEAILQSLATA